MKININKKILVGISLISAFCATPILQGCQEEEDMKWVDLRYRVEDAYTLEAANPETVSFLVKSTDPWEVFGNNEKVLGDKVWYTITPATGKAGEKTAVEILCQDNKNLDPRTDTINIKSDYWIGKKFSLTQKGSAFLTVGEFENISQFGSKVDIPIHSNHSWTAKVTKGDIWLSIVSGDKGGEDYKDTTLPITITASANSGELRRGEVTVYDHHGVVAQTIECIQNGVILDPEIPENGEWFKLEKEAQVLKIAVESNAQWTVTKENPEASAWYEIEQTEFEGNGNIIINISASELTKVREGILILATKAEEGATPLVKKVRFKQAHPLIHKNLTNIKEGETMTLSSNFETARGQKPGRYDVYIKSIAGNMDMRYMWPETKGASFGYDTAELRYWIQGGKTQINVYPWCNDVHQWVGPQIVPVDTKKPHVFSFNIEKYVDEKTGKEWIYSEWLLDGKKIGDGTSNPADCISDGVDKNGVDDLWKCPWSVISNGGYVLIQPQKGNIVLEKIDYIAPIDWGE